jgi:hypothetical protein
MASTYTTGFGIEKIGTGEQAGAWGTTTNHNADILDRIASYKAVALSGTTHTLTVREASPGSGTENLQDGMYRVIKFTGALGANNTVTIAPNTSPAYFIIENATTDSGSSGPYSVILTQGSGANVTVQNGKNAIIYCDGAGSGAVVYDALADLQVGTLEVTGAAAIDGALTQGGASQFNSTITVGVNDTGYDVKLFGAASGSYLLWDESADDLILAGAAGLSVAGGSALAALTTSGIVSVDDTTDSTSGTTGSIHTDGGVGIAKDLFVGVDAAVVGHAAIGANAVASTRALTVVGASDGTGSSIIVGYNSSLDSKFSVRDDGYTVVGAALAVLGNIAVSDAAGPVIQNEAATATNPTLVPNNADPDTGIGWVSANKLSLIAGGTGTATVTGSGLGIGTAAPAYMLDISHASTRPTLRLHNTDTSGATYEMLFYTDSTANANVRNWGLFGNVANFGDMIWKVSAARGGDPRAGTSVMDFNYAGAVNVPGAFSAATVAGGMLASKAEMEAASAADHIVTPAIMNDHPGMVKCWVSYNQSTAAILAEHNSSSVTDSATGRSTTVWDTDFSAATYATGGTANAKVANHGVELIDTTKATTGCGYACKNFATNTDGDTTDLNIWAAGDQ